MYPSRLEHALTLMVFRLLRRLVVGRRVRMDGQRLDLDVQLLLRLGARHGKRGSGGTDIATLRRELTLSSALAAGPPVRDVHARELTVHGGRPARLYTPHGLPAGSALLVYYHGGGFVMGDLDSHDRPCRFLASNARLRVLAVDYRLAPENPFPAAVDDAVAAYRYARTHAMELGADPQAIAVGGDSAGGNLALVVGLHADPDFVLALYPSTNPRDATRSRRLFTRGLFRAAEPGTSASAAYIDPGQRADPRFAPARAEDVSTMPPTHIVTAGFDPRRDEAEMFAARLARAGVPVLVRRHPDLAHGFVGMIGLSKACAAALRVTAGSLRTGLARGRRHPRD